MTSGPDFDSLLNAFLSGENSIRRPAEAVWEEMKRRAPDEVLEKLCGVMARRDAPSEGLRALAAVLLRTLFDLRSDLWFRIQSQTKEGVKTALLACLTEEPVPHIRRKLTHTVGLLAGVSASEAEWPELMSLTVTLCGSGRQSPDLAIVGLDLVNILSEFCLPSLSPHEAGLMQMFDACLVDPEIGVRVAALKACCSFIQDFDGSSSSSPSSRSSLVQKMMSVLEATVSSGDESAAKDVLEALNVIAAKKPQLVVEGQEGLHMISKAMLHIASTSGLEVATRELSLEFLTSLCESAPSVVEARGADMVQALVPLAIHMLVGQQDDGDEGLGVWLSTTDGNDDDSDDEDELSLVAASVLSRVSIALGGKAVMSSALPVCSEFLADASDWRRRKAGLLTLLLIGEGCGEDMAESGVLPQIVLGPVLAGMGDAHPRVRHAALACLGQMTEDYKDWDGGGGDEEAEEDDEEGGGSFQGTFHAQLLPALVQSLGGPNANMPRLQAAAAGTLLTFCHPTSMNEEWLYAPAPSGMDGGGCAIGKALLEALCVLVRGSPSVVVKEEALTAVGCVAQVLGPGFGSFYGTFVPLAKEVLSSTSPVGDIGGGGTGGGAAGQQNTDTLRGKAMEAIALMGQAVGLEVFRADAHQVIQVLINEQQTVARDPGNPQSTYTLQALARMAGVLGEEFLPYLDDAVSPLLAALSIDAEIKVSSATSNIPAAREEMEAAGLTPLEMDLRGVGRQLFGVNTSLMQAKESACKTLYQYTEDLGEEFAPHAAGTLAVVLPNLGPRNAVAVQVVSSAIVPRLVGMASRRAAELGGGAASAAAMTEAQGMLDASVDALCEVIARIGGEGSPQEAGADMEPACIAADSLSTVLGDHCNLNDPSPLSVTGEREVRVVAVLRDAAAASMRRTEAAGGGGGHHPLAGMTGAVDSAELEEQEEWEEDLLTSAVDGIGCIIKGRREAFVSTFDAMLKPFVLPLLKPDQEAAVATSAPPAGKMPPSQRSFGVCMCIDILEHCGSGGCASIFPALLPALLRGCADEVSATRQACAYGLGVAADLGGVGFDSHAAEALRLLLALVSQGRDSDDEEIAPVTDNAVSAAFRVVFARGLAIQAAHQQGGHGGGGGAGAPSPLVPVLSSLLSMLPLTADIMEAQDCHRRIVERAAGLDPVVCGGVDGLLVEPLVSALAGMMHYQPNVREQEDAMMAAAAGGGGGGGGCVRNCCPRESEEELWARQWVDRETRLGAEKAVAALRAQFPGRFGAAWAGLEEDGRQAIQTPTSSIHPYGMKIGCPQRCC